jgi:hypothetical protein
MYVATGALDRVGAWTVTRQHKEPCKRRVSGYPWRDRLGFIDLTVIHHDIDPLEVWSLIDFG